MSNPLEFVREYYGKVLQQTKDLKTSACTSASAPHPVVRSALKHVPQGVKDKFYGCGSRLPWALEGKTVVDLGSGSGQDCYLCAYLGAAKVIGVDMTPEQLKVAREHVVEFEKTLGRSDVLEFQEGFIENLSQIADNSVDLVISNCVVNLSPRKDLVLAEVHRILKTGGEFFFSDVYADRRLSEEAKSHQIMWGECIAGALYENDFIRLSHRVGFADPRVLERSTIEVNDYNLKQVVGNAKFSSVTYRLFKLEHLESLCEDYGQVATYKGTIQGNQHAFMLDDHHLFPTGKPVLVCGNTASMLQDSYLAPHFSVTGNRDVHFGEFPCGGDQIKPETFSSSSSCGPSSSKSCC